jgi:RHS repeat-associated protein
LKITSVTYDSAGNVETTTDPLMHLTQYSHDLQNRLTEVIDAASGHTLYDYDLKGNLTSVTDAENRTTQFTYDSVDEVTKFTNPLGEVRTFSYDLARNLSVIVDAKGQRVEFTYDDADQLTGKVLKDAGSLVTDTVSFSYDALGNLATASDSDSSLTFTYDPIGRLSTAATAGTQPLTTIGYTYDKNGNRITMTDLQGAITSYVYDELNRLIALTSPEGVFTFGLDDAGRRTSLDYPNGTSSSYSYNAASLLTGLANRDPSQAVLSSFGYTYDDNGNRDTRTTLDGLTTYSYDSLDRLVGAIGPDPANPAQTLAESYSYDAVGNRISSHLATGQVHDSANRLLEDSRFTFVFDSNGNTLEKTVRATSALTTFTWDVENRLLSVSGLGVAASFQYDALGRRIAKVVNGSVTRYVYDLENILEEYDSGAAPKVHYTHGVSIDEPLAREDLVSVETTYFQADGLGSVVGTTNDVGQPVAIFRYDSFGNPGMGTALEGFSFTGREWDADVELYHYRARTYDPTTGRFLSEDPIGFRGGVNFYSWS